MNDNPFIQRMVRYCLKHREHNITIQYGYFRCHTCDYKVNLK